ncbi:ArnT family glycosyltransferase [Spirosoma rhododendri]|uniref:Glycosyltransferase family 39 protein n=1 Tax=Spirosoma rhododendri TaxID=2728024 RepID=A0A7L5DLM2_9BACT|nr:glycosyltransferase family 39 protein [Spirosoma rhododendri]QJD78411.1 glycosyltransferase family 39 protein [Spirosoma rhododendri]
MPVRFFTDRLPYWLIGPFLLLFAAAAYHRATDFDDAWFAEQAYFLLRDGVVRSEFFRGINHWEERIYVFHKLYIYLLAGWTGLFGFSAPAVESLGTAGAVLNVAGLYALTRRGVMPGANVSRPALLGWTVLLYVSCGLVLRYGFVARPETMNAAFGLWGYYFLSTSATETDRPDVRLILAAIFAGLAALTHLNGLMYGLAGLTWLAWQRRWRIGVVYGLVWAIVCAFYFTDVLLDNQWARLAEQFRYDPATRHLFGWVAKLNTLISFHQMLFHNQVETAITLMAIFVGWFSWQYDRQSRPLVVYLLASMVWMWLLTRGSSKYYMLLILPFVCLLAGRAVVVSASRWPRWGQVLGVVITVLWLGSGLLEGGLLLLENEAPIVHERTAALARRMGKPGSTVIAPLDFFFDQIGHYRIHSLSYYYLLNQHEYVGKLSLSQFFDLAAREHAAYVITDPKLNMAYDIPNTAPARIGRYHRIFQDDWNSIYRLEK